MIPIKQTVYSQVNREQEGYFFTPEQLNEFIANVVEETLKTAANKAECCKDATVDLGWTIIDAYVEKESITSTFEETFKKIKV